MAEASLVIQEGPQDASGLIDVGLLGEGEVLSDTLGTRTLLAGDEPLRKK